MVVSDEHGQADIKDGNVVVDFRIPNRTMSVLIRVPLAAFPEGNRATPVGRYMRLKREGTRGRIRVRADWVRNPATIPRHRKRAEAQLEDICKRLDESDDAMREQQELAWCEPPLCPPGPQQDELMPHVLDSLAAPVPNISKPFLLGRRSTWDRGPLTLIEVGTTDGGYLGSFVWANIGPDRPPANSWGFSEAQPVHIPLGAFQDNDLPSPNAGREAWVIKPPRRLEVIRRWTPHPDGGSVCEIQARWLGEVTASSSTNN